MLLPTKAGGTPEIDESVYDHVKELWAIEQTKKDNYRSKAFKQGGDAKVEIKI